MKKNILIVVHKTDLHGGPGHSLLNLLPHFDNTKYNYHFLVPDLGELSKAIKKHNYPVKVIKLGIISKKNPFPFMKSLLLAIRFIRTKNIDLIHFQFDRYRDPFFLAAKLLRKKVIVHIRAKGLNLDTSWLKLADGFIFNSHFTKKITAYNIDDKSQYVVNNAVNPEKSSDSTFQTKIINDYDIDTNKTILLTVSRVHPVKNIEDLIEMISELRNQLDFHLYVVGNIQDQNYYKDIKTLISSAGVEKYLTFVGHQSNVTNWYELADALIHPVHFEPFGNIFLEASYSKLPIITYNSGGATEILTNRSNALLVNIDPKELAHAVLEVMNDSALKNKLVQNAYLNLENYNGSTIQNKIESIYESFINNAV